MADGTLKVGTITTSSGSGTITLGQSGETLSVPSGATLDMSSGTMTLNSSMKNTPAFFARRIDQGITENSFVKVVFSTEDIDTDNAFDSSTGRFTVPSGKAGKYHFSGVVEIDTSGSLNTVIFLDEVVIYKNGSSVNAVSFWRSNTARYQSNFYSFAQTLNLAASDYVQLYARGRTTDGSNVLLQAADFSAHKLIGV